MVLVPQDLAESLGLEKSGKTIVSPADETKTKRELETAKFLSITVAGRTWETDCLIGPPGCETLLGQLVLERST